MKLTGACLPRKATLPLDTEVLVGNFVYLSYEVLKGEIYVTSADVYGFALLIFELLTETKAFEKQRSQPFYEFLRSFDPAKMLGLHEFDQLLTPHTLNLLRYCLAKSENDRSTMATVVDELGEIKGTFKLNKPRLIYKNRPPKEKPQM